MAEDGMGQHYSVQILLPRWVDLEARLFVTRLRGWRPEVRLTTCSDEHLTFSIPTDDLPLYVQIFQAVPETFASSLTEAIVWTPTWHERWDVTANRCPASIVVAMTTQRPINYASVLLSFLAVLDTTLWTLDSEVRDSAVLHWIPAKQLLTFQQYLQLRTELGPCGPAVNIRIANATGKPGELLADTVGLAELGLPDLQILFSNRDPKDVVSRLRAYVRNLFVGERLDCSWIEDTSLVPPRRDALTLFIDYT
jgi:hypothetical protein